LPSTDLATLTVGDGRFSSIWKGTSEIRTVNGWKYGVTFLNG
jgi:hypothetical protein